MPKQNSQNTTSILSKVWAFCQIHQDDTVGCVDYLDQLTYLMFLKMADEYSKPPHNREMLITEEFSWETFANKNEADLESHYNMMLRELAKQKGILGQIFEMSQNSIQGPSKLYKLVERINVENWTLIDLENKVDFYEGLLGNNTDGTMRSAGQNFTPLPLIKVMVECIHPESLKTIADSVYGTSGFFLAANDWITKNRDLTIDEKQFLKFETFFGNEIVARTHRLALMNLLLNNIGGIESDNVISPNDSLIADTGKRYDYILANPPFVRKSSMAFTNPESEQEKEDLNYNRQDFWVTTSNKQLNFVQHIHTMLKTTGKAAVVLTDTVLFEGGVGETVRKKLLENTDLHTILRLPTGVFNGNGVKANVLFFDRKPSSKSPWTKDVWVYDYRTNIQNTHKKNPLQLEDLRDFITLYNPENRILRNETFNEESNPEGRWRKFSYNEIIARDKTNLDITWFEDKSLVDFGQSSRS
jgi:type I restriction enzyme M protein